MSNTVEKLFNQASFQLSAQTRTHKIDWPDSDIMDIEDDSLGSDNDGLQPYDHIVD